MTRPEIPLTPGLQDLTIRTITPQAKTRALGEAMALMEEMVTGRSRTGHARRVISWIMKYVSGLRMEDGG
jgi:hypothetical protein